jgi:hypothetical protein
MKPGTKIIISAIVVGVQSLLFWNWLMTPGTYRGLGFLVAIVFVSAINITVGFIFNFLKKTTFGYLMITCGVIMFVVMLALVYFGSKRAHAREFTSYTFQSNGLTYQVNLSNLENTFSIEPLGHADSIEYHQHDGDYYNLNDTIRLSTEGYINGAFIANGKLHRFTKKSDPLALEKIE